MTEKITYKVKLDGSDGKEYVARFDWVKEQLGIPTFTNLDEFVVNIRNRVTYLESRLDELERPARQEKIFTALKSLGKPVILQTLHRLIGSDHFYVDVNYMVEHGLILRERRKGKGQVPLYSIFIKEASA